MLGEGVSKTWFALSALVAGVAVARADMAAIPGNKDNTLYEQPSGLDSNGAGPHVYVGKTGLSGGNRLRRGLVTFDIAGNIPAGSTVTSVTLGLTLANRAFQGNQTVSLHKVLASWGEGTSDAGDPGGAGVNATLGDATWIHRFYNTVTWTSAGGDFVAAASASRIVSTNGAYTWGSTAQMVADVQSWLHDPDSNFGWIIRGNEVASSTALRFSSKENSIAGSRPVLTMQYTPPPPAVPALAFPGAVLLATALTGSAAMVFRKLPRRGGDAPFV